MVCAIMVCLQLYTLSAQTLPLPAEQATNRRLGYLSDASAVGWNPAMLGVRSSLELMAAVPLAQSFAPRGPFSLFAKLAPFAVGYAGNPSDSTAQLYAGAGFSIWDDVLWLGASGRLYNKGEINKLSVASLRYAASAVVHPVRGVFVGFTASTMGQDQSENALYFTGNVNYSPLPWLTAFVGYSSYTSSVQRPLNEGKFTLLGGFDAGASASLFNDVLILTGNYNFSNAAARLSAEVNVGGFGAGLIAEGGLNGYTAIARFSSDPVRSVARLYDTRADDDGCRIPADTLYAQPDYLMKQTAWANPALAKTLAERFSPTSGLYSSIQRTYYAPLAGKARTITGDSIAIGVRRNLATQVLNVQNTAYPLTTVALRAVDSTGKTVAGLGMNDFFLRDTALQLVSVVPADSTTSTPVDVVFVIDCSGSMQNKIDATRNNARAFVDTMRTRGADYRIGGILYGVEIVDVLEPTNDFSRFERFISKAKAKQPDEYAPLALDELARMKLRPNAQHIAILITDELTFVGPRANEEEAMNLKGLWERGVKLYSIVKFCDDNSARLAWLTLGRQYNIRDPFDQILSDIGKDITTTYAVTYKKKTQPAASDNIEKTENAEKITVVKASVANERGQPVSASVLFRDAEQNTLGPKKTDSAGAFQQNIVEGRTYTIVVEATEPKKYLPLEQTVDLTATRKGDTVSAPPLVLKQATYLRGVVKAESGAGEYTYVAAEISLREEGASTLVSGAEPLASDGRTGEPAGGYWTEVSAGKRYAAFVQPYLRDRDKYLPLTTTVNLANVQKGDTAVRDFVLRLNPREVQLTGTITTSQPEPKPLAGGTITVITASDAGGGKTVAQSSSDANGKYSVAVPKDADVIVVAEGRDYFPDTARIRIARRDTSSQATHDFTPEWKKVTVTGRVESAKTGQTIVQAEVTARDGSTTLVQTSTDAAGNYRLAVPKEATTVVVGQSNEYFYDSFEVQPRKGDTVTVRRNLRLQEELTLRINFPTDQFNNPTPYILDSNGVVTTTTWQNELDRVAKVIVFDRKFITKLTLVGHTDDAATGEYNMRLGQRRAEFVRDELVKRGVPLELLETRSKGETATLPRRTGETLDLYRARCRRVELVKVQR
jgi:outer membrane protein OmpA-like peptidoglycan-associated protein